MGVPVTRAEVLAGLEPGRRQKAGWVLDALVSDENDLGGVLAYDVLRFVWYELPVKWTAPLEELTEIAQLTAEVMRVVGRGRVAELIESDRTAHLHAAWRTDRSKGAALWKQAMDAAGIDPPDTDTLAWSDVMGIGEPMADYPGRRLRGQDAAAGGVG